MSRSTTLERALAGLAAAQHGVISRAQARRLGFSESAIDRRVAAGAFERLLPGVFRLPSAPSTWHQRLAAACLWGDGAAWASHRAAAALWRLDGIEPAVEISSTRHLRCREGRVRVHVTAPLAPCDATSVSCIRTTNVTRTLIDLAAVVSGSSLELAVEDALRRRLTSAARLRWRAEALGSQGRPGARSLRTVLEGRIPCPIRPESALEERVIRLLHHAGLPPPVRQFAVRDVGRVIARVDLAYPEARLAIEVDGYRWHSGRTAWQRDLERMNRMANLGWRVLRYPHDRVTRGGRALVAEVSEALSRRFDQNPR